MARAMRTTSKTTDSRGNSQPVKEGQAAKIGTVKKVFKIADALSKGPDAEQAAQDKEDPVQFEGGSSHHGSARTEATRR